MLAILKELWGSFRTKQGTLTQNVTSAGIWVLLLQVFTRILTITRTVVLARLLVPNDFGVFGIVAITLSFLQTFTDIGIEQAVIQKKVQKREYLDNAWININ